MVAEARGATLPRQSLAQEQPPPPPPEFLASAALAALPPAGAGGAPPAGGRETARQALTWERRPTTPPVIKDSGYQHYARQEPGQITKRFGGARGAPLAGAGARFGCRTKVGIESAAECFRALPESEVARWKQERAEDVYMSHKREPLGATAPRGFHLPEGLGTRVAFGIDLHVREQERLNSTKATIFPPAAAEAAGAELLYKRTHGSYEPGEQRRRDYSWGEVDPAAHRFGLGGAEGGRRRGAQQQATMKQILQPDLDEGTAHPPPVVSALLADHELTRRDALGRHRLLGGGDQRGPPGGVFGAASGREAEPCVGELIRSSYAPAEQEPDADLGKSLREGWRAAAGGGGGGGAGGGGGRAAAARGGAGGGARQLLAPLKSAEIGVGPEDLVAPRGRDEIDALVAAAGLEIDAEELEEAFALAAAADEDGTAAAEGAGGGVAAAGEGTWGSGAVKPHGGGTTGAWGSGVINTRSTGGAGAWGSGVAAGDGGGSCGGPAAPAARCSLGSFLDARQQLLRARLGIL